METIANFEIPLPWLAIIILAIYGLGWVAVVKGWFYPGDAKTTNEPR